jgi:hypothetical protein
MWVTENQLDQWVRGNAREAQGRIVELVWRLVAASSPNPRERRFPLGDSIGQHGPDGVLETDLGFPPFVPEGRSYWEIGTGVDPASKATRDYQDLVDSIPEADRKEATFVFVTPLSGTKGWEHTWKDEAQERWLEERRKRGEWKDVRIIDGTKLLDWARQFPAVEFWLAHRVLNLVVFQIEIPEISWDETQSIGDPPPLVPQLFLAGREEARAKLTEIFSGTTNQLKLETRYPEQVVDFVCAHLADLGDESRAEALARCVIVSGIDAWNGLVVERERLILVAGPQLDLSGDTGTRLIQKARRGGHAVLFGGPPGGIPDPTSAPLRPPSLQQIQEALEKAGYNEQRARTLAQKSGGNLGSLLRCLQNLSVLPEWSEASAAAELAIAAILGGWNESVPADRSIVETLSGKSYGEWIGRLREAVLRPGTPLIQQDGRWKFAARFEGWYALGPRIFDEHLDRLKAAALAVLQEDDPQFDLPAEERYAASIHGKVLAHSRRLRSGIAEGLALMGSHPSALTSCSMGKAETTAVLCVRELLKDGDWRRWASLDDVLPLLAEAAPDEFLERLENVVDTRPEVFEALYAQEGGPVTGRTYLTGILWALETLAWEPAHLGRVVLILGGLAALDPGGQWSNRPDNSLRSILLPWLPQTCASITQRISAVTALMREQPAVGWKLLLQLLPGTHSSSAYTRRPTWRTTIPDDWKPGVTGREYWDQVSQYAATAVEAAKQDATKLGELLGHWAELPSEYHDELMGHLASPAVASLSDAERQDLWSGLVEIVTKHRRFAGAKWAMEPSRADQLAALAEQLTPTAPSVRYRRLFSERHFDLYDERGNYEQQYQRLEELRREAVREVADSGGAEAVLTFSETVEAPWRVGLAFGSIADEAQDEFVLPRLLLSEKPAISQFTGGFVWGRFGRGEWAWVDTINTSEWSPGELGQFLSFLPFSQQTWDRVPRLLGESEKAYWRQAAANPYQAAEADLAGAIKKLLEFGRPNAAIRCIYHVVTSSGVVDRTLAIRALLDALGSSDDAQAIDTYAILEIIKKLQDDPEVDPGDMFRIEWSYLALLDEHHGAAPKFLANRLSRDPSSFCELVRLVFRPKGEEALGEEVSDQSRLIATNAYRLLTQWNVPPGTKEDGGYDGSALTGWIDAMKHEAGSTDHLEIAMTLLGQVLTYVPADPDGLWIHRAAAGALNSKDATDLRDGFRVQILNSRGVHWVDPTGAPERELAAEYRDKAAAVEEAGYHRLATVMREIAASYEREAERVVQEHTLRTEF